MAAYYNEIDHFAAAWLRNLIAARFIPDGEVDERSILDVQPGDPDGEFSEAQRKVGTAILLSEARYGMARNAPEALQLLDAWSIPRSRRVRF